MKSLVCLIIFLIAVITTIWLMNENKWFFAGPSTDRSPSFQKKTQSISLPEYGEGKAVIKHSKNDNQAAGGGEAESRITIDPSNSINIDGVNINKTLKNKVIKSDSRKDELLNESKGND